jgi:hypothetical protein
VCAAEFRVVIRKLALLAYILSNQVLSIKASSQSSITYLRKKTKARNTKLQSHYRMKLVTTKTVEKLLQSLNNDPRLQALDDTTILSEEQYPVAFDALIMRIKDSITLTTTVDTLNYNDTGTQAQSIPSAMRIQLKEKQVKLRELLQLNPTIDNPLDELTYSHWIHRVTNICLDAAQMALTSVDTSPGMNYLFAPSSNADNTVRRGDKRKR